MKKKNILSIFAIVIILILGPLAYFRFIKPKLTSAAWFDDGYGYRKAVAISNSSGSALSDFQVNIGIGTSALIANGKMQSNCNDIRLTDTNGKLLPHWIEPNTCNTSANNATVWTKVPSIPTSGGTVYVYYGNPSATNTSSTTKTFIREISGVKGSWNFNEGVGTTALDSSGNNNTGTLGTGGSAPIWVTGNFGIGLSFNGSSNQSVSLGSVMTPTLPITIEMWVKPSSSSPVGIFDSAPGEAYVLRNYSAGNVEWWATQPSVALNVSSGIWQHLVFIFRYSNGTRYIDYYKNGAFQTTGSTVTNSAVGWTTFKLGNINNGTAGMYNGLIDDFRIYNNAALSASEISDLYGTGTDRQGYTTANYPNKVLVRKWATTNPTSTLSSTEEQSKAPVAYWSFNEGQGSTVNDGTSNRNNGTLGAGSSAPTWQTEDMCVSGKCLKFDGSNDYVYRISTDSLRISADLTLGAWVYLNNTGVEQTILGKWDESNNARSYRLWISSTNKLSMSLSSDGTSGNTYTVTGSTSLSANKWYYLQGVADVGTNMKVYIDGKLDGTDISGNPSAISANLSQMYIGTKKNSSGNLDTFLNGRMDEVKIYPYARTAAEIKADYNARGTAKGVGVKMGSGKANIDSGSGAGMTNGLVGYWRFEDGSGGSATDSSGNGNTGTLGTGSSSPGWVSGMYGIGLSFDGSNDYARVNDNNSLDLTQNITVSAWVKGSAQDNKYIVSKATTSLTSFHLRARGTSSNKLSILISNDGSTNAGHYKQYDSTAVAFDNTWHHVAFTFNGANLILYVDGSVTGVVKNQDDPISTIYSGAADVMMGATGSDSPLAFFNGSLDEVRIYNRALQPSEVADLYNWAPGPVAYYNFNEGVGSSAYDTSGNSNNGVWSGTGTHWTNGKYGKAGKFNGSSDYISVADWDNINDFSKDQNFTISTWIKMPPTQNYTPTIDNSIIEKWSNSGSYPYILRIYNQTHANSGKVVFARYDGSNNPAITSTTTINDNKWHFVSCTKNGSTLRLYIDGVQNSTDTTDTTNGTTTNASSLYFGERGGSSRLLTGSLDEVKIYNYARTQKQIVEDMLAGSPSASSKSPLGYWKFDEGYGTTTNNSGLGGLGLLGTLGTGTSAPSWTNNGKFGKALSFDGSADINMGDPASGALDFGTGNFSVTFWVKHNSFGANNYVYDKGYWRAGINGYGSKSGSNGILYFLVTKGATVNDQDSLATTYGLSTNQWYHITQVYDKTNLKMYVYIDGKLNNTASIINTASTDISNSNNFYVGEYGGSSMGINGLIDEVKIYNYALTEDEVKIDYNQGKSLVMGSLSSGTGNTAPSTAASQEYCIPGDTAVCSPPVGRWDFNEGVGTSAYDTSGNGNTGTLGTGSSAPTWATGKIGKALRFDGNNDYVETPTFNVSSVTYEAWIYLSNNNKWQRIVAKSFNNPGLFVTNTNKIMFSFESGGTVSVSGTTSLLTKNWYHVVGNFDDSTKSMRVYVNGILEVNETKTGKSILTSNDKIYIGTELGSAGGSIETDYHFDGSIDQVRIYNYARSPAQIAWDYNRGAPVAWWDFDECEGTTAHDRGGLGTVGGVGVNSGTINIGGSGTQTSVGTCASAASTGAWYNGSSGKYNASLNFDGTDDYVSITDNTILNMGTSDFTLSTWLKGNSMANSDVIFSKTNGGACSSTYGFHFSVFDSLYPTLHFCTTTGSHAKIQGTTTLSNGTWYLVTIVVDRDSDSNTKVYLNGSPITTTVANLSAHTGSITNTLSLAIGSESDGGYYWDGQIDDVKIWNYALTGQQVKTLFNQGSAVRFGPSSGNP